MEDLPDYQRPFGPEDYRDCLDLPGDLRIGPWNSLFHACHGDEFKDMLRAGRLLLRSEWHLERPRIGRWTGACAWCGLNLLRGPDGNRYGPIQLEFPLSVLNGGRVLVFHRTRERDRYFFVQHKPGLPELRNGGRAKRVRLGAYFDEQVEPGRLSLRDRAIYDVIVTRSIPLRLAKISGVLHQKCIGSRCGGLPGHKSDYLVRRIAELPWVRRKYGAGLRRMIPLLNDD